MAERQVTPAWPMPLDCSWLGGTASVACRHCGSVGGLRLAAGAESFECRDKRECWRQGRRRGQRA